MSNHLVGYLICSGIILFGVVYHLSSWMRVKRQKDFSKELP